MKAWLLWPLLLFALPGLLGCELGYAVRQGWHQALLLSRKRPVQEVLVDPSVDGLIKKRIALVLEVKEFGLLNLGLSPSSSYDSFIQVPGDSVAVMVSACKKDALDPFMWGFPFVGRFPYKGFFDLREAVEEESALRKRGYDTHLSRAVAFSALGWFPDPLYSSMLKMQEVDLIYTILHEMVHGTVFIKDRVDFNERLATFVAWKATALFTEQKYGKGSQQAVEVSDIIEDEKRLARFLEATKRRLSAFYSLPLSSEEKIRGRDRLFKEIQEEAQGLLAGMRTGRFDGIDRMEWNNASVLALWRYRYDVGDLEAACAQLGGDLKALLTTVKRWAETGADPEKELNGILSPQRKRIAAQDTAETDTSALVTPPRPGYDAP